MVRVTPPDPPEAYRDWLVDEINRLVGSLVDLCELHRFDVPDLGRALSGKKRNTLADAIDVVLSDALDRGEPRMTAQAISEEIGRRNLTAAKHDPLRVRSAFNRYRKRYGWSQTKQRGGEDLWEKALGTAEDSSGAQPARAE